MKPKYLRLIPSKILFHSLVILLVSCSYGLFAQDAVSSGAFITEPPTLLNLGFEWKSH
ncbi:hypothetical protein [Cyclobacterium sp. SYSU L10401]|uniref:hypothetical protein n=1 Tax=Cyclobacterium sp. SYSU L10401 TaxID=2678657 RepID=UPI0013D44862|nr:hypothetical protein [Cyclobacterium sp. SYSU L10401]